MFRAILLSLALLAPPKAALADAATSGDFSDISRLSLLPGWMRSDGLYMAAIRIDLAPGWKTYWRAPGDNGIAPIFDWSGSQNIAQVGYIWPTPQIIDYKGTRTIGYSGSLILPVLLKPADPAQPIAAQLNLNYGVCDDICVPANSTSSALLDTRLNANKDLITAAIASRTAPAKSAGLQDATCTIKPAGRDFVLRAELNFKSKLKAPRVVVIETGSELIWVSEPDHMMQKSGISLEADLQYYGSGAMTLDRGALRFTLLNDGSSIEVKGCTAG